MFRTRVERELDENGRKSKTQKDTWFRSGGATSTLTVPVTPNGILAETVRKNLLRGRQPEGTRVKVIEDGGVSSRAGLVKSNQFGRKECGRDDCAICYQRVGNKVTRCFKSNVGYEVQCGRCPNRFSYLGETSRTGYTRTKEHMSDYRAAAAAKLPPLPPNVGETYGGTKRKNVKSFMWEHTRDCHDGAVGQHAGIEDYMFSVSGVFRKCLERQVDEGLRILQCENGGGVVLNSKNEWFTPRVIETVFRQQ